MKKNQSTGMFILGALLLIVLLASSLLADTSALIETEVSFSQFMTNVENKKYTKVDIIGEVALAKLSPDYSSSQTSTSGSSTSESSASSVGDESSSTGSSSSESALMKTKQEERHKVILPEGKGSELLVPVLQANDIEFEFKEPQSSGHWLNILTTLFIPLIILVFFIMILRNAQSGGSQAMSFGKSKAKMQMDSNVKVKFTDVAGIDEAKAELEEVVDYLKNPERYQKLGAKIPKGVLLVGSPGTGKTLLAKAVAGEAGVPFFTISGSDFVEMFVGVGASRVRDLFEQAKKHSPCIIFVDEIDAVGRQRGAGMGGGHDEREQTLNQLLVEMDGFDPHAGTIVLAATNRPDILDNALLRPGRFDRQVMIDRPDVKGREEILRVHSKGKPMNENVDLKLLAKRTPGFTGADLSNLLNEGALTAARDDKTEIDMDDIENSIEKVMAGPEKKSKIISEKDKEITAFHEVGHALVGILTPGCDPVRKVSIIPRGMALGLTWTMPDDDKVHVTRSQMIAQIAMLLGGRVAEDIVFGDVTTGASNDLERSSAVARKLITVYGMNDKLGPVTYGKRNEHVFMGRDFGTERDYGEEVATTIDREVKDLVLKQYEYVTKLLTDNRDMLDRVSKVLLEKETIDEDELKDMMDDVLEERGEKRMYNISSRPKKGSKKDDADEESTVSSEASKDKPEEKKVDATDADADVSTTKASTDEPPKESTSSAKDESS